MSEECRYLTNVGYEHATLIEISMLQNWRHPRTLIIVHNLANLIFFPFNYPFNLWSVPKLGWRNIIANAVNIHRNICRSLCIDSWHDFVQFILYLNVVVTKNNLSCFLCRKRFSLFFLLSKKYLNMLHFVFPVFWQLGYWIIKLAF